MLICLSAHPTAAVEIATPSARNDGVYRWLVLLYLRCGHRTWSAGAVPPPYGFGRCQSVQLYRLGIVHIAEVSLHPLTIT